MKPPLDCSGNLKVFFGHRGLISCSLLSCQIVESWRSDRANLSSDLIGSGQEVGEGRTPSDRHSARGLQRNLLLQQKSRRLNHQRVLRLLDRGEANLPLLAATPGARCDPLGLWILLSGRRHAMDDRQADQTENTHPDLLHRHVEQIGSDRQAGDQYDVSDEVNPK